MSSDAASARIGPLRPDQLHWVGEVLSRSHADYPAFRHTFSDPARRRKALRAVFTGIARDALRFKSVYAAETDDGRVLGVAIWLPPRKFPWSARRQARGAPWLLSVLRTAPRSFPTFLRTGMNAARLHPADLHWYLEVMGVTPAAQGKGLGGRLLEPVLEIADREATDCYLETSNGENVGFYERRGFHVENDALPLVPGGPTHWAMRRALPRPRCQHWRRARSGIRLALAWRYSSYAQSSLLPRAGLRDSFARMHGPDPDHPVDDAQRGADRSGRVLRAALADLEVARERPYYDEQVGQVPGHLAPRSTPGGPSTSDASMKSRAR